MLLLIIFKDKVSKLCINIYKYNSKNNLNELYYKNVCLFIFKYKKLMRLPQNIIYYNNLIAIIDPKVGTNFNWFYSVVYCHETNWPGKIAVQAALI